MSFYSFIAVVISLALFIAIVIAFEVGYKFGSRGEAATEPRTIGAMEAAIFGIMGLLIAFSFSGAASRFDTRRQLIVQEANAIGTAYLRIEELPEDARETMRDKFRQYLDSRLNTYKLIDDLGDYESEESRSKHLQNEIWSYAVQQTGRISSTAPTMLMLPALNQMFDIATTRIAAREMHPPIVVFGMLGILVLIVSTIFGFGAGRTKNHSWFHVVLFAAVFTLALYVIIDFEFPRIGLIRVDSFDKVLIDLRNSMG